MDPATLLDAAAYRALVRHLQERSDSVSNIDMMTLTGFCRNCLAKWRHAEARRLDWAGRTYADALVDVYGESYESWKGKHQRKATPEQLNALKNAEHLAATHELFVADPVPSRVTGCCAPEPSALRLVSVRLLTVSDRADRKIYPDLSGPAARKVLEERSESYEVLQTGIVPDDLDRIVEVLETWSDTCDVVLTVGGTGLSRRDVTPEASLIVARKRVPGIPELLRREAKTDLAALSRAEAVLLGESTLLVNLPGSVEGVEESLAILTRVLPRAVETTRQFLGHVSD